LVATAHLLSLHDALPISWATPIFSFSSGISTPLTVRLGYLISSFLDALGLAQRSCSLFSGASGSTTFFPKSSLGLLFSFGMGPRSEEHTSELQSRVALVC